MFLLLITSRIAIRLFSSNKILFFIKKLAFDGFYPLLNQMYSAPRLARRGNLKELAIRMSAAFDASQLSRNPSGLLSHGTHESFHPPMPPDLVFFPKSTHDISEAMRIAKSCDCPVIPFGVGTSLEGHIAALQGGLCVDFGKHMHRVLQVNVNDMDCKVQAGCTRIELNNVLKGSGLFFPTDPGMCLVRFVLNY